MVENTAEARAPKTGSKMERNGVPEGERAWIQARERATQQAETATMAHARMEFVRFLRRRH